MPLKARRDKYIAAGTCANCGSVPRETGLLCVKCRAKEDKRARVWYTKNAELKKTYSKKMKAQRKLDNKCISCAGPKYPEIDDGYAKCINCREKLYAVNNTRRPT